MDFRALISLWLIVTLIKSDKAPKIILATFVTTIVKSTNVSDRELAALLEMSGQPFGTTKNGREELQASRQVIH